MDPTLDLKQVLLDYVNMARRRPQLASDPGELDNLEQAALANFQGAFAALHAPVAPMTWEARTLFLGANPTSERIQLDIPFPCMIVGTYPSISILTTGSSTTPGLDDIDVTLDLNIHEYMTQAQGTTTATSTGTGGTLQRDGTFSTLGALGTQKNNGGRLLGWVIPYRTAQLGVTFRWKQGASVFKDTIVSLAFFARGLDTPGGPRAA